MASNGPAPIPYRTTDEFVRESLNKIAPSTWSEIIYEPYSDQADEIRNDLRAQGYSLVIEKCDYAIVSRRSKVKAEIGKYGNVVYK